MQFNEHLRIAENSLEHAQKCAARDQCECGADWETTPDRMGTGYDHDEKCFVNCVTFLCKNKCGKEKQVTTPMRGFK